MQKTLLVLLFSTCITACSAAPDAYSCKLGTTGGYLYIPVRTLEQTCGAYKSMSVDALNNCKASYYETQQAYKQGNCVPAMKRTYTDQCGATCTAYYVGGEKVAENCNGGNYQCQVRKAHDEEMKRIQEFMNK